MTPNRDQADLIERLKEAAAKATPGPWPSSQTEPPSGWCLHARGIPWQMGYLGTSSRIDWPVEANAKFIALCSPENILSLIDRLSTTQSELDEARGMLKMEERRSAELLTRLDKARPGAEPDFCYDPEEWEFTSSWEERDQVHGYGENLAIGEVMQIATLIRGPRKWVANVPVTWDDDGDPDDAEIKWFDSEDAARASLTRTAGGEDADKHCCPICLKSFEQTDLCADDVELGICHAECLEGSPVVDLETGEPSDGPVSTYRYDEVFEAMTTDPTKWAIDRSTDSPILTYEQCSVIQDEQAEYVLDLIRRAALPQEPSSASMGVVVKALEWRPPIACFHEADGFGGTIQILDCLRYREPGNWVLYPNTNERRKFDTLEDAKAAAQADFEQRVRSCLSQPAKGEREGGE